MEEAVLLIASLTLSGFRLCLLSLVILTCTMWRAQLHLLVAPPWGPEELLVGPQKPSLQAEQVPQPQLTGQVIQTLTCLVALPGLVPFYRCLSCIGRILKLDLVLQMWSNKQWIEGDNPFPPSAGHAFIDTSQDAASSLCCQGTLLARAQLAVCQDPRAFSIELLSGQFFIIYLSTLPDCKIPTCKQKYCGRQCFMIEFFIVKAEYAAEGLWICYFQ